MSACFADTSFFLAMLSDADALHQKALQANETERSILTSYWVLLELANHLARERSRGLFGEVFRELMRDSRYEIVPADQRLLDQAIALYQDRPDKDWSLTDCTSFVLMRERGVQQALSGDHHFRQAGFVLLLKNE